jgi:isopenicillin-N epimerase
VFIANATTGVNAVVRSLKLRRGDEMLTTNLDYNACRNVLAEAVRASQARLVVANIPIPLRHSDQVLEAVMRAVTPRTRLAMLDHVTSNSALVLPVKQLIRELAARGVETLIDGAHAPGMVPLNLSRLQPAYYTGNLHKWVCAPKGAAFLWVRQDKQSGLQPAVISHGNNTRRRGYAEFQDRFDWAGTSDPTPWFCVAPAIQWMEQLLPGGWPELRRRNHQLAAAARKLLCKRLEVPTPCPETMLGSMAAIPLPSQFQGQPKSEKIDAEQQRLYDEFGIEVPFVRLEQPQRRYFRISAQIYNSLADYDYLAKVLPQL